MTPLKIILGSEVNAQDNVFLIGEHRLRLLAHGDSWFSIGSVPLAPVGNVLTEMRFSKSAIAVNCARPGNTLGHMADYGREKWFERALLQRNGWDWHALLLSCGGNDLIDVCQVLAHAPDGSRIPLAQRIFRTADEWGDPASGAARYISDAGFATFARYFKANLQQLLALRDAGASAGRPAFFHGYGVPTPRPAGVFPGSNLAGPWLYKAVVAYCIPEADYMAVGHEIIRRFNTLGAECAGDAQRFPNLHFLDSMAIPLVPAALRAPGDSGDWINEIHLNRGGLKKFSPRYAALVEQVLQAQGLPK